LISFYAPCPKGLESALAEELTELGVEQATVSDAGVAFRGNARTAMCVNLESRIASRVLMQVAQGNYEREDDIYT
jgi:putative N6-adenine-specific DNA methylase